MAEGAPVLVVDVGGTLLTRTRPGLTTRVVRAIHAVVGATAAGPEAALRVAVLTSADHDACLRALALPSAQARAAVATELSADAGDAVVLPGAEDLLRTATGLGWRVLVATNAGPGTPDLPPSLARHLSGVVESRGYGLVKEDPRFWARLVDEHRIDPGMALVVGDQEDADRWAPAAAGLQSRLVDAGGVAAVAADIAAAGAPPPDAVAVLSGNPEAWAGRDVVVSPHLTSQVVRTTRTRMRYAAGTASGACVVVRRSSSPPAVLGTGGPLPGLAWLLPGRERARYVVPAGLADVLDREGVSLDVLSPTERRHALSMIREARSAATVAERTADLVRFLHERGEDDARP